jgi:photosynthetic reaction center cytochrome c subunit
MTRLFFRPMALALVALASLLAGCERPPVDAVQRGFRGTGMEQVYNPRTVAANAEINKVPVALDPASPDGPKAGQVYQNVKVLGSLSVGEFARNMTAITNWVAPNEGCVYCHNPQNFADDSKYTKVVARRMIQMTQYINADWKSHVAATGVTCYTCHRGKPVPAGVWFSAKAPVQDARSTGGHAGQNEPSKAVAFASLPSDPFTPFLSQAADIRVNGPVALPDGNRKSIKQAEWTYGLMMHMSDALGVNCTYCHNTRAFSSWETSTTQRVTSWYGIRLARDLNLNYLDPLTSVFPAARLGPNGDVAKINCATCHQGAYKPLYGASMIGAHPELVGSSKGPSAAATAVPAAAVTPVAASPAAGAVSGATVFFASGSSALTAEGRKSLGGVIGALKNNGAAKVSISGYHSATGNLNTNQELAKKRAFAVRDALTAAGVSADRLALQKPLSAGANLSGEDPKARRVEVTVN